MRHLREVVRIAPGIVNDRRHDRAVGCSVASELVGNEAARLRTLALQQLAEESPCSGRVSSTLDREVDQVAVLIDGTPKRMTLPLDRDEDLVQESGVS